MGTRNERVVLSLDDQFSSKMVKAAAATALLKKELGDSGRSMDMGSRSTDRLSSSLSGLNREASSVNGNLDGMSPALSRTSRDADRTGTSIDKLSGRLVLFAKATAVLGPALVPLGAAAVGGIAGLSTQLGFAAIAAGVTALAFNGVGDALGALDAAQLDPSVANLEKLQVAMDALGPAGRQFVLALDELQPAMQQLQTTAQAGIFPGWTEGLQSVMTLMPELQGIVRETAGALGDLGRDAGANLAGPKFEEFFNYLQTSARPILTELGQSFGNVFEGLANMMVAFDPVSRGFSAGLLSMSQGFAEWSRGLSESQGFQEFVGYIQSSGPMALDALGSISNALVALVTAAAPVGQVILPVLSAMADGFAALANSPIGPPLIAAAAALSVLTSAVGAFQGTAGRLGGGGFIGKALGVGAIKAAVPTLGEVGTQLQFMGQSAEHASAKTLAARESIRGFAKTLGPAAGLAAGLAVATTGLGEGLGISNTASLALMGSMAGVPGMVGGAVVGAFIDAAKANDSFGESLARSQQVIKQQPGDLKAQADAVNDTRMRYEEFRNSVGQDGGFWEAAAKSFKPSAMKNTAEGWFGDSDVDEMKGQLADLEAEADAAQKAFAFGNIGKGIADGLSSGLNAAQAAIMDTVGAVDPLRAALLAGVPAANAFDAALERINATLSGRASFRDYEASIDDATAALKENGKTLDTNTAAGRANQAALDNIASSAVAYADTLKGADRANFLSKSRTQFLAAADAMGMTDARARRLATSLGLVRAPKDIKINTNVPEVQSAMGRLSKTMNLTPKKVRTVVEAAGADRSNAMITALSKKYKMTPKQVRTILEAVDNASAKAKRAEAQARKFARLYKAALAADDKASAKAKQAEAVSRKFARQYKAALNADDRASGPARSAAGAAAAFEGTYVATFITRRITQVSKQIVGVAASLFGDADGGIHEAGRGRVFADGGFTDRGVPVPRVPQIRQGGGNILWSEPETGWEAYISGKPGQEERNAEIWRQAGDRLGMRFEEFAAGGLTAYANGGPRRRPSLDTRILNSGDRQLDNVRDAIRDSTRTIRENDKNQKRMRGESKGEHKQRLAAMRKGTRELERTTTKLTTMRDARNEYAKGTGAAFVADPFQSTLGGFRNQVQTESRKLGGVRDDLATLDRRGLNGALYKQLAASGNSALIDQFSKLSRSELNVEEARFNRRNRLTRVVGNQAANEVYGAELRSLTHEVRGLQQELKALRRGKHVGNHVTNFNGRVSARDTEALAKKLHAKQQAAARLARRR